MTRDDDLLAAPHTGGWTGARVVSEVDWSGRDLSRLDPTGFRFLRVRLRGADLRFVRLLGARAQQCDLSASNLERVDATGSELTEAFFDRTVLDGATLAGVTASDASFVAASLRGVDLRGAKLLRVSFAHAALDGAQFSDAELSSANLHRASGWTGASANLSCANLRLTDVELAAAEAWMPSDDRRRSSRACFP
ncbi:MAG: pentapeptide repeat-containing protein [Deltaproteobacteria bacterium]|nr:pentapeptide repeat-containing protein [Deltaproteobacteria bacterium]